MKTLLSTLVVLLLANFSYSNNPSERNSQNSLKMPAYFIPNYGQFSTDFHYVLNASKTAAFIGNDKVVYQYLQYSDKQGLNENGASVKVENLSLQFLGMNKKCILSESGFTNGTSNFFYGNNPANWQSGIRNFSILTYENLYPKTDLIYYNENDRIKTDFVIHAGGDINQIRLNYSGMERLSLSDDGSLVFYTSGGVIREEIPVACQQVNGRELEVRVKYHLFEDGTVGFTAENYDKSYDLIIDPELVYSTFLGGSGDDRFYLGTMERDSEGYIYATGRTSSSNFPTTAGSYDITYNGGAADAFVIKFNPSNNVLAFSTFFGSTYGYDAGYKLKLLSPSNDILVTGAAGGSGFPTTTGAYQTNFGGGTYDFFILRLKNTGDSLVFSTFLGGMGDDIPSGLTTDEDGFIYVVGQAKSGFPTTPGSFQTNFGGGTWDATLSKLSPDGSGLIFSTYIGGSNDDKGTSVLVDTSGYIYFTGGSNGGFPVTPGAYDVTANGNFDVIVCKMNPDGNALVYSTYVGGPNYDSNQSGMLLSENNEVTFIGYGGNGYPTTPGVIDQTFNGGTYDIILTKLNAQGTGLVYSTFLGSPGNDVGYDIQYANNHQVLLTGYCENGFPIQGCTLDQSYNGGASDAVVCLLSEDASSMLFSTYMGGTGADKGLGVLYTQDTIIMIGETASSDFPTTSGCYDPFYNGGANDLFIAKIALSTGITASIYGPASICPGTSFALTNTSYGGTSYSWDFGDGTTSTLTNPTHVYYEPGMHTIQLIAANSCSADTAYFTMLVNLYPITDAGNDQNIELGAVVTLTANATSGNGAYTYLWSNGAGTQTINVSPNITTTYTVTVSDEIGCIGIDSVTVIVLPPQPITCTLESITSCPGNIVVPVTIENVDGAAAISLILSYDTNLLTYSGYQNANSLLSSGMLFVNGQSGNVQIAWFSLYPLVISSGVLLELQFIAQPGTSNLSWDLNTIGACQISDINNITMPAGFVNGSIVIENCSILDGYVRYLNTNSTPLTNATVFLKQNGITVAQANTNSLGHYSFSNLENGFYSIYVSSNHAWGGVNASDALLILKHFMAITPLTDLKWQAGNVDGSSVINSTDAMLIAKRFIGMINSFDIGDWVFTSDTVTINGTGGFTRNISALCTGDVDASFSFNSKSDETQLIENGGSMNVIPGADFKVPVFIAQPALMGAASISLKIPASVYIKDVIGPQGGTFLYNVADNEIRIAWYSTEPFLLNGMTPILNLVCSIDQSGSVKPNDWLLSPGSVFADKDGTAITGLKIAIPELISKNSNFIFSSCMPNPASTQCQISYYIPEDGKATIKLFNRLGQEISELVSSTLTKGNYSETVDVSSLMEGVYYLKAEINCKSGNFTESRPMVIVR